jgi:hypothetical protein
MSILSPYYKQPQLWGVNDWHVSKVTVTAAQILAMNGAPVTLLLAPGTTASPAIIVVDRIVVITQPGSANFAAGGVVTFVYHGGSVTPHASSIAAATINSGTASYNQLPGISAPIQIPSNTGIDITNATGAFTTGNGSLLVVFRYFVQGLS